MQDLKLIYESLSEKYRSYFIEENPEYPYFWRKQNDDLESMLDVFAGDEGIDGFTAILCLYRESIIFLDQKKYLKITFCMKSKLNNPNLNTHFLDSLSIYINL